MVFSFVSRAVGVTDWAAVDKSGGGAERQGMEMATGCRAGVRRRPTRWSPPWRR